MRKKEGTKKYAGCGIDGFPLGIMVVGSGPVECNGPRRAYRITLAGGSVGGEQWVHWINE